MNVVYSVYVSAVCRAAYSGKLAGVLSDFSIYVEYNSLLLLPIRTSWSHSQNSYTIGVSNLHTRSQAEVLSSQNPNRHVPNVKTLHFAVSSVERQKFWPNLSSKLGSILKPALPVGYGAKLVV